MQNEAIISVVFGSQRPITLYEMEKCSTCVGFVGHSMGA